MKKYKLIGSICEWNPKTNDPSTNEGYCTNPATVCLGANGAWHLCESCSLLPNFNRYKVRTKINWRSDEDQ